MSCYSLDFRQQVLKSFKAKRKNLGTKNRGSLKKSIQYVKNIYGISKITLLTWLEKDGNNDLSPKKRISGKPYKINKDKLNQLNQDNKEDYTLKELGIILGVTGEAIRKYFIKNKITFKKKNYGIEKVI